MLLLSILFSYLPCFHYSAIVSPTSVFEDDSFTKRVGFFTRTISYVTGEGQTVFTGAIVFEEGSNAGSEIVSAGFGPFADVYSPNGLVYPITGGVGNFVGLSGDISQRQTVDKGSFFTIHCL